MHLEVVSDRLVVISDLHLGNPYSQATEKLKDFADYLLAGRFDLCINGDGLDILQSRFPILAAQTLEVIDMMRQLTDAGLRIFYVVGNHDVALETVLSSWLSEFLTPFLNVRSGRDRIRIEHGHIYDPLYIASPRIYGAAGALAAPFLRFYPDVYKVWSAITRLRVRGQQYQRNRSDDWAPPEVEAARMLAERGFDVVVLGHTHRPERVELDGGALYLNAGNWLRNSTFVEIIDGAADLRRWDPVARTSLPFDE